MATHSNSDCNFSPWIISFKVIWTYSGYHLCRNLFPTTLATPLTHREQPDLNSQIQLYESMLTLQACEVLKYPTAPNCWSCHPASPISTHPKGPQSLPQGAWRTTEILSAQISNIPDFCPSAGRHKIDPASALMHRTRSSSEQRAYLPHKGGNWESMDTVSQTSCGAGKCCFQTPSKPKS